MRVFVLGTGRCGTMTFARAAAHLEGWTAGHESRAYLIGPARFDYPDRHVEADCRLAWFLGELGHRHPAALYVHLTRDREAVAQSFLRRWPERGRPARQLGMIAAFARTIVMHGEQWPPEERLDVCRFYVDTVTANIADFLVGRRSMTIDIDEAPEAFPAFADAIGATGGVDEAVAELAVRHNASGELATARAGRPPTPAG